MRIRKASGSLAVMRPLTISDAEQLIPALQSEIRRSGQSRYDHGLHAILLVAEGLTCPEVSELLGDAPRTIEYWVRRFEQDGFVGLRERQRPGRASRLSQQQHELVGAGLRASLAEAGMEGAGLRDGKTLSAFVKRRFGVELKVRQCQRLFRKLGFRSRKPRPSIAHADPEQQAAFKKTPGLGDRSKH